MRIIKMLAVLAALIISIGMLSGCDQPDRIPLSADDISGIWMETYPAKSDSPKSTDDAEVIETVVSYLNGLTLRPRTSSDEDVDGMTVRIDILMNDGSWKTFRDGRTYLTDADGKQYVMQYEQAKELDSIYPKLDSVSLITGVIAEAGTVSDDKVSLLVAVDNEFHGLIGDKTTVTVQTGRLYKSGYPNADVGVGDKVEFTLNGGIRETYPTQCDAAKLTITESADGLYYQHLPSVPEDGDAYFVLFRELFDTDPGLNGGIQYISVDLTKTKSEDTSDFYELMRAWCERNDYILLEQTYDQLKEGGWITDLSFPDGIIISFEDVSLNDSKLVTNAKKWRSGDGAIGAEYTLKKTGGKWSITDSRNGWIS